MQARINSKTKLGKGCGIAFFSFFAIIGLVFAAGLAWTIFQSARVYTWEATPCEILTSSVKKDGANYTLDITYRYRFQGREYTCNVFRPDKESKERERDVARIVRRYHAESTHTCYVNAANPKEAVLERPSLWLGLLIIVPLIFVAVGVGGIIFVLRFKPPAETAASERHLAARRGCGPLGLRVFGLIFFAVGSVVMYILLIGPWLATRDAAKWTEVPCVILSSRVETVRDDDGSTYALDIRYRYEWDGREYEGDRYNFQTGTSNLVKWKREVVQQYPKGANAVCLVNPADPSDSVLSRDLGGDAWFGLIPAAFVLIGLGVIFGAGRMAKKGSVTPSQRAPGRIGIPTAYVGGNPAQLKAASSPLVGFVFLAIFALIWNGFVWGILLGTDISGFGRIFLSLFALIGLLIAAGAVYCFLALLNPKPVITASSQQLAPGDELKVDFRFTGKAARITKLTITLEGRESATYRRGTTTSTDHSLFAVHPVLETSVRSEISSGTARVAIPADALHTFIASNNTIKWLLRVHGDIPKWPDVNAEFPIEILPAPVTQAGPAEGGTAEPALIGDGALKIGLRGGGTAFRPGDTIEGAALWELPAPPELAEIRLLWHTRGKGSEDGEVVATQRFDAPAAGDTRTFALTIPPAPFSFSGRLVSVIWSLELVVKPGDRFLRAEIIVGPNATEIRLPEITQPKRQGFPFQTN